MKYPVFCSCLLLLNMASVQAETETCRNHAAGIVAEMQKRGDYPEMTDREIRIAKEAAMLACETTFSKLETDLEKAKSQPESTEGIDPGMDPIGWLKEQWHKEPIKKKGLERLKKRAGGR